MQNPCMSLADARADSGKANCEAGADGGERRDPDGATLLRLKGLASKHDGLLIANSIPL